MTNTNRNHKNTNRNHKNHSHPIRNQPTYAPPMIITYTAEELIDLIGPAHANTSPIGGGVMGNDVDFTAPDHFSDPNND